MVLQATKIRHNWIYRHKRNETVNPIARASLICEGGHNRRAAEDKRAGLICGEFAAGLLAARGYEVIGLTLQLYDHGEATHRKGACCAGQDIQDARAVAARLGIPHFVLDFERRFQEKVIEEFAASYASGETPVPCVACNQFIKFADLFETAKDLGADALATGQCVVVHCRGGLGRSGTIAACCLVARGRSPAEAIGMVRRARPGAVEVRDQEQFVSRFARRG